MRSKTSPYSTNIRSPPKISGRREVYTAIVSRLVWSGRARHAFAMRWRDACLRRAEEILSSSVIRCRRG